MRRGEADMQTGIFRENVIQPRRLFLGDDEFHESRSLWLIESVKLTLHRFSIAANNVPEGRSSMART